MKIKTFFCTKLMDTGLSDYESEPVITDGKLVDIKGKSLMTLVFKYCKNCSLIPDSQECIQHQRNTNRQLRGLSKYWIDMRNHPKYNIELTKDVPDNIPIENIRNMSNDDLYELLYKLHLKTIHVIRCSTLKGVTNEEIEAEVGSIIDAFELAEHEYQKCYNEVKNRGIQLKTSKTNEFLKNAMAEALKSVNERELLKFSIQRAQVDKRLMFIDRDED